MIAFLLSSYAFIEWLNTFERRKINIILFYVVFIVAIFYSLNLSDLIFFEFSLVFYTLFFIIYITFILYKFFKKISFFG